MRIRPARADDVAAIEAIVAAAYAPYVDLLGRRPAPMDDDYRLLVAAGTTSVAEFNRVVGLLVLVDEPDCLLLDNVAVDPARHGQGVGTALLAHADAEARRRGLPAVRLYTNVLMTRNIGIYLRAGYVETHRGEDRGFNRVFMRKPL